jgi:MFS family permease
VSFVTDLRDVVRERDFRRLYATRLVAQLSDGVFQVALASYVFFSPERQTSAAKVAAAFAVLLLPYSLVGPFAGVLLDRWRRRQVLVYANVVRAAIVLWVAALVASDQENALFYGSALAVTSVNRFFLAALSAALPHVVPARDLVMANSVATTSGTVAAGLGAGVAFAVHEFVGKGRTATATIVLAAAGIYLCSSLIARRMHPDLLGPDFDPDRPQTREALRRVALGLADGARHVWHHRTAGQALLAIAAHRFFYGISTIATLLLYRNYFNSSSDVDAGLAGLAFVVVASGCGYFVAALITPEVTPSRISTPGWITVCLGAAAVIQLAFGTPYTEPTLVAGAFFLGVMAQSTKICVDTLVQSSIDDAYRGRVFSFYDVLFNVSFVSAAAFAALTLPENGKSYAVLVFIAAGYAVTACCYALASRRTPLTAATAPDTSASAPG